MKYYATKFQAIDPQDGKLKTWMGNDIPAISWEAAEKYCQKNGLGYLRIIGELVMTIPEKNFKPNWEKAIDMETVNAN